MGNPVWETGKSVVGSLVPARREPRVRAPCPHDGAGVDADVEQGVVRCRRVAAVHVLVVLDAVNAENRASAYPVHDLEEVYEHLVGTMFWQHDTVVFVDSPYDVEEPRIRVVCLVQWEHYQSAAFPAPSAHLRQLPAHSLQSFLATAGLGLKSDFLRKPGRSQSIPSQASQSES